MKGKVGDRLYRGGIGLATSLIDGEGTGLNRDRMILSAAFRALPQIFHPAARRVLLRSLLLTLLLFVLLGIGVGGGLHAFLLWMGWGGQAGGGQGWAEATATGLVTLLAGWLLFRALAMAILGFFSDSIVIAVESESYAEAAAQARPVSVAQGLRFALASLARNIGWNLLALPFYIALLVTGIGTIGLFLALNAYLLGRDLADMVEPRHPELPPIGRSTRWLMGLVSAGLFLLPVVNLLAPIWSAAMAVHVLHGRKRKPA